MKHTDFIPSLRASIWMVVMVMELWTAHPTQTRFAHVSSAARAHVPRWRHPCRARASHMRGMSSRLNRLPIVNLGHSSDSTTSQSRVLVAVAPTIHSSLDQSSFSTKTWIEFCQGPADCIALSLVHQTIASVLVLATACSWIDAVLSLEFWAECVNIDRFHIASDGILHLYAIARVFECNPLNTVVVLANYQWGSCWNWTWRSIWVNSAAATAIAWSTVLVHRRPIWGMLLRTQWLLWRTRELWYVWLHFRSWASSHTLLRMLTWVLLHLVLTAWMRHEQIWLRSHRGVMLLLLLRMGRI